MENTVRTGARPQARNQSLRNIILPAAALLVLAVGGFIGFQAWSTARQADQDAKIAEQQAAAMAAIEDRWGIRVTQVAATADGGLVDLRYQITDSDKAIFLYDDVNNVPKLITEDEGVEIAINSLPHEHDLEFGQTYFVIYRNVGNAVKPGALVTVAVGDLSVEHFAVEQ